MVLSAMYLNPLDDRRDTHAAANTQRYQRAPGVAALQLVNHGAQNHRAGSTERMAHGDGTAVDVELLVGDVQVLLELEHYGREGFVELEQVDVVNRETGAVEHLERGRGRAGQHDHRVGAAGRGGHDACPRGRIDGRPRLFIADRHQCGTVDDSGRVAAGVDMVDLLHPVVLLQRHVIEAAHRGERLERGLELAEAFLGGVGAHVLVMVKDQQTILVADRHHGLGEVATRPRLGG